MRNEGSRVLAGVDSIQAEVARRCGVSQATVSNWISGKYTPTIRHRRTLESAYKIPFNAWDSPAASPSRSAA